MDAERLIVYIDENTDDGRFWEENSMSIEKYGITDAHYLCDSAIFNTETDEILRLYQICDLLNQQSQRILELEEQLKNAVVSKFNFGSLVCYISKKTGIVIDNNTIDKIKVVGVKERIFSKIKIQYKLSYETRYFDEEELFATKEEAQARLEELKGE